jgi:hypothetical protein
MDSEQQLAVRPISTKAGGGGGFDGNTSFDVYYSMRTGAVPFLWESAPGTPKHAAVTTTTKAVAPDAGGATMLPGPALRGGQAGRPPQAPGTKGPQSLSYAYTGTEEIMRHNAIRADKGFLLYR